MTFDFARVRHEHDITSPEEHIRIKNRVKPLGTDMTTPKIVYNEHERHTLVELVMQHRSVIDSRRVDADTLSKKRLTWLKITNEYNRQPRVRKRLTKQLRRLWENTKARAKKGFAPSGQSVAHELLNESVDEPTMETIHTEDNPNADLTSGCDEVYVIPNGCATRIHASKSSRVHPKKTRNRLERNAEANGVFDNSAADIEMEEQAPNVDDILAPSKWTALDYLQECF